MLHSSEWWMEKAACLTVNPETFFDDRNETTATAKAICAGCPVADLCLDYAIRNDIGYGIFAGIGPRQRRRRKAAGLREEVA